MTPGPNRESGPSPPPTALDRRAPFAANGQVGPRARQTQERILDAARRVFSEVGYEAASLEQIAQLADRSRVSVYQYFADKDHLFRELTSRLAEHMWSSLEHLEPIAADAGGWDALHRWLVEQGDLHRDHRPVFREFATATSSDTAFLREAMRTRDRQIALFASKVVAPVAPQHLSPVVGLLLAGSSRILELAAVIRTALPAHFGPDRITDAMCDVIHRSLFGPLPSVNVRDAATEPTPRLDLPTGLTDMLRRAADLESEAGLGGRTALAALLAVGDEVIVRRGHLGTRVEDVTDAAGVSRGAFYRYFHNRDDYVQIIAARALQTTSDAFGEVPDLTAAPRRRAAVVRRWLRSIEDVQPARRTLLHARAGAGPGMLETTTPGSFDWGRRRMAHALRDRSIGGDVDAEALVLLGMVEGYGAQDRTDADREAMVRILELGFVGSTESITTRSK